MFLFLMPLPVVTAPTPAAVSAAAVFFSSKENICTVTADKNNQGDIQPIHSRIPT